MITPVPSPSLQREQRMDRSQLGPPERSLFTTLFRAPSPEMRYHETAVHHFGSNQYLAPAELSHRLDVGFPLPPVDRYSQVQYTLAKKNPEGTKRCVSSLTIRECGEMNGLRRDVSGWQILGKLKMLLHQLQSLCGLVSHHMARLPY